MKPLRALLFLSVLGLLSVPVSGAAFSPPFYVSSPGTSSSDAHVGVDAQGKAVFVWQKFDTASGNVVIQMRTRSAGGVFGPVQTLSTTGHDAKLPQVAVDPLGDAVFVWQLDRGDASSTTPIQGRVLSRTGVLGPIFTVSPKPGGQFSHYPAHPRVAVDADGDAAFAWQGYDSSAKNRIFFRTRSKGGALGSILTLSDQKVGAPEIAMNAGGKAVVTWVRGIDSTHSRVEGRTRSAGGALGPVLAVGGDWEAVDPDVGISDDGAALFVWRQKGPNGGDGCGIDPCPFVLGRSLSAGGTLALPQGLSTLPGPGAQPHVAVDADGDAFAVWVGKDAACSCVRVQGRSRSKAGVLGPVVKLSGADGTSPAVDMSPAGNAVVAWWLNFRAQARSRSAGGTLGLTKAFSVGGQTVFLQNAALSVGDGGHAAVGWEQQDGLNQCGQSCERIAGAAGP